MCNISKAEDQYALVWSKKIKAINLLGGKCNVCNTNDIFTLQFHHSDKNKEIGINQIKAYRWSVIEKEVKKCILLCSNCHAELHCDTDGRRNIEKIKKLNDIGIDISSLKCKKCGYVGKNYSSLQFHHVGLNKKFDITRAINNTVRVTAQELIDEISKCIVLCNNCHRREHTKISDFNRLKEYIGFKLNNHKELRSALDREVVRDMYFNKKMRQVDIVKYFKCSKGTISLIIKNLSLMPSESGLKVTG